MKEIERHIHINILNSGSAPLHSLCSNTPSSAPSGSSENFHLWRSARAPSPNAEQNQQCVFPPPPSSTVFFGAALWDIPAGDAVPGPMSPLLSIPAPADPAVLGDGNAMSSFIMSIQELLSDGF